MDNSESEGEDWAAKRNARHSSYQWGGPRGSRNKPWECRVFPSYCGETLLVKNWSGTWCSGDSSGGPPARPSCLSTERSNSKTHYDAIHPKALLSRKKPLFYNGRPPNSEGEHRFRQPAKLLQGKEMNGEGNEERNPRMVFSKNPHGGARGPLKAEHRAQGKKGKEAVDLQELWALLLAETHRKFNQGGEWKNSVTSHPGNQRKTTQRQCRPLTLRNRLD